MSMLPYPKKTIASIKKDRLVGLTVPELSRKYQVSKTTIWRYTHSLRLTFEAKQRIQSQRGGSVARKKENLALALEDARAIFRRSFKRSIGPLIFTSLYWAEGTKSSFVFTNTDGQMIALFLKILREDFSVSNDRLQLMIRIGTHQDPRKVRAYWSLVTGMSKSAFRLNINQKHNKTTVEFGLCRITVARGGQLLKTVLAINRELTEALLKG